MPEAEWNDMTLTDTPDTVVVEGKHYFPIGAINSTLLESGATTTVCPWKGTARYYAIVASGKENKMLLGTTPNRNLRLQIKGRIAFWNGVKAV